MPVAAVVYGAQKSILVNLDCRVVDLGLHLAGIGEIDGEADLAFGHHSSLSLVDIQGEIQNSRDDNGEQLRAMDVIKPHVQHYLVKVNPNVDYKEIHEMCKALSQKPGVSPSKKSGASLPLPSDDKLWKKLYSIQLDDSSSVTAKYDHFSLPNSVKDRVLRHVMEIEQAEQKAKELASPPRKGSAKGKREK